MNTKLKIKNTLLIMASLIAFTSCEYNVEEETIDEVDICNPTISFVNSIKPIIDNNCVSCHNGGQFPDLRTFNGISNNAGIVKQQVVSRSMPLGGSLSNDEIELIRCWVENGAINN